MFPFKKAPDFLLLPVPKPNNKPNSKYKKAPDFPLLSIPNPNNEADSDFRLLHVPNAPDLLKPNNQVNANSTNGKAPVQMIKSNDRIGACNIATIDDHFESWGLASEGLQRIFSRCMIGSLRGWIL